MASEGLVGDVRGIASDGLRMVRTRLELLAIEVQQEKEKIFRQLVIASATLFCLSFGLLLVILWLALFLPEGQRQVALGGLSIAFFVAGGVGVAWLRRPSSRELPLQSTVSTLRADESALARTAGADD